MNWQRIVAMLLLFGGLSVLTGFTNPPVENRIIGTWQSADNDLRVELYAHNGQYHGRLVWFLCEGDDPPMADHRDTENPNPALRNRPWLGMNIVEQLTYRGGDEWSGGKVYDPNTGHTFEAMVRLMDADRLMVRGYWKLPMLGRSLTFRRVAGGVKLTGEFSAKK